MLGMEVLLLLVSHRFLWIWMTECETQCGNRSRLGTPSRRAQWDLAICLLHHHLMLNFILGLRKWFFLLQYFNWCSIGFTHLIILWSEHWHLHKKKKRIFSPSMFFLIRTKALSIKTMDKSEIIELPTCKGCKERLSKVSFALFLVKINPTNEMFSVLINLHCTTRSIMEFLNYLTLGSNELWRISACQGEE